MTADAIARRAGVSKATIYKWWPNKSLVALDAYLAGMTERVADAGYGIRGAGFYAAIEVVDGFLTSSLSGRLFGQFIAEGQSDPGVSGVVSRALSLCPAECRAGDVAARGGPRRDS